jgi:hypothetical protein
MASLINSALLSSRRICNGHSMYTLFRTVVHYSFSRVSQMYLEVRSSSLLGLLGLPCGTISHLCYGEFVSHTLSHPRSLATAFAPNDKAFIIFMALKGVGAAAYTPAGNFPDHLLRIGISI